MLPLVEIDHDAIESLLSRHLSANSARLGNFPSKFSVVESFCLRPAMCDWKIDVQTFVVNIKFPRATYHKIVPSTEELYCLNRKPRFSQSILAIEHDKCLLVDRRGPAFFCISSN